MTSDYIHILVDYNYWARDRVLASAEQLSTEQLSRPLGSSFGSVLDTLVHIYFAEWIWYRRWQGESPSARPDTSELVSVAALRDTWMALEAQIRAFVDSLGPAGLHRMIEYKSLNGQSSTQVATMLRQLGAKPAVSTDLIVFFREHTVRAQ